MLVEAQHPRFMELLLASDAELLTVDFAHLKARLAQAKTFAEEGFWSPALVEYIEAAGLREYIQFHWLAEQHYARKLHSEAERAHFDHYYLIGYARIISLMMRYHVDMGHDKDDFFFIHGFLESQFGTDRFDVRILEVGTGAGKLLADLASIGYRNMDGIEMTPSAYRLAHQTLVPLLGDGRLFEMTFDDYCADFPNRRYDVVVQSNLIEHIAPHLLSGYLENMRCMLDENGFMVVITPHRLSGPHDITRSFRPHGSVAEGFHLVEYTLTDLETLLTGAGFGNFMSVRSLPSVNEYWDSVPTEEHFRLKRDMEQFLVMLDWKLRKPIIDGMYFKGLICQKMRS